MADNDKQDAADIARASLLAEARVARELRATERTSTEEGIRRYWPLVVTAALVIGNWFVMDSKVKTLADAQSITQQDIKNLSAAFYEMKGAFDATSHGGK